MDDMTPKFENFGESEIIKNLREYEKSLQIEMEKRFKKEFVKKKFKKKKSKFLGKFRKRIIKEEQDQKSKNKIYSRETIFKIFFEKNQGIFSINTVEIQNSLNLRLNWYHDIIVEKKNFDRIRMLVKSQISRKKFLLVNFLVDVKNPNFSEINVKKIENFYDERELEIVKFTNLRSGKMLVLMKFLDKKFKRKLRFSILNFTQNQREDLSEIEVEKEEIVELENYQKSDFLYLEEDNELYFAGFDYKDNFNVIWMKKGEILKKNFFEIFPLKKIPERISLNLKLHQTNPKKLILMTFCSISGIKIFEISKIQNELKAKKINFNPSHTHKNPSFCPLNVQEGNFFILSDTTFLKNQISCIEEKDINEERESFTDIGYQSMIEAASQNEIKISELKEEVIFSALDEEDESVFEIEEVDDDLGLRYFNSKFEKIDFEFRVKKCLVCDNFLFFWANGTGKLNRFFVCFFDGDKDFGALKEVRFVKDEFEILINFLNKLNFCENKILKI